MAETVEVVFSHHWTDRSDPENVENVKPGDRKSVSIEVARQVVNGHVATYATKKDAEAAGAPGAKTAAEAKAAEKAAAETSP